MLFGRGYALQTMQLWVIYFCSLLNLFLFVYWLPEVLHLTGMTPSQAVFASSIIPLGGMSAVSEMCVYGHFCAICAVASIIVNRTVDVS